MNQTTDQMCAWSGDFGRAYTHRNKATLDEMEALYLKNFGIGRRTLNEHFLGTLPRDLRILEVGTNIGNQLLCLQSMGFEQLTGIELQTYAIEEARSRTIGIDFIQGSARALPFDDNHFDLVFTSGVLIHIHPIDLPTVMGEIHRCSRRYVWGLEYWAETMTEVNYRDHAGLLWKADYARLYRDHFSDLSLIREENLKYLDSNNRDSMFLLEKLEKTGAAG